VSASGAYVEIDDGLLSSSAVGEHGRVSRCSVVTGFPIERCYARAVCLRRRTIGTACIRPLKIDESPPAASPPEGALDEGEAQEDDAVRRASRARGSALRFHTRDPPSGNCLEASRTRCPPRSAGERVPKTGMDPAVTGAPNCARAGPVCRTKNYVALE